jgi:hypothetical protein
MCDATTHKPQGEFINESTYGLALFSLSIGSQLFPNNHVTAQPTGRVFCGLQNGFF